MVSLSTIVKVLWRCNKAIFSMWVFNCCISINLFNGCIISLQNLVVFIFHLFFLLDICKFGTQHLLFNFGRDMKLWIIKYVNLEISIDKLYIDLIRSNDQNYTFFSITNVKYFIFSRKFWVLWDCRYFNDRNWLFLVMNVKYLLFYIKSFNYNIIISSKKKSANNKFSLHVSF